MFQVSTPAQKALIQLIESLIITALIAALIAIGPVLTATGSIDWKQALIAFSIAFIFSIAHGGAAYLKAYNAPLAAVVDADINAIEQKLQPQESVVTATTSVTTAPAPTPAKVVTVRTNG